MILLLLLILILAFSKKHQHCDTDHIHFLRTKNSLHFLVERVTSTHLVSVKGLILAVIPTYELTFS